MLLQLSLRNFALIDLLRIEFDAGLNVLTGETGAGKSILIDALRLALGERMEMSQVRDKTQPCLIEAIFAIEELSLRKLSALEVFLKPEDECLILKREITPEGRSKNYINQQFVNLSQLKEIGALLIDIHGQYDHQSIFDPASHLTLLDRLVGGSVKNFSEIFSQYQTLYRDYAELLRQKEEIHAQEEGREREIDLLKYQVREIEDVAPKPGEIELLKEERIRMAHSEKLYEITQRILENLDEDDQAVSVRLGNAVKDWSEWLKIDASTQPLQQEAQDIQVRLEELVRGVRDYRETLSFDPARLKEIDVRLDDLEKIERKYGGSLDLAIQYLDQAKKRLDLLENAELYQQDIAKEIKKISPQLKELADEISMQRKKAALELTRVIERELKDLGIVHAKFDCSIQGIEFGQNGQDRVEFFISPNAGEALKPLAKIVSGGEASRIMLAIKRVLAKVDTVPTLIFDEIDANIGGRLGSQVGQKLKDIAAERQVLLITHLPQIASFATRHFKVSKRVEKGKTLVEYKCLSETERVKELSQMMSGERESSVSKAHAEEMLKLASK